MKITNFAQPKSINQILYHEKITALYLRLSHDDAILNVSNSIVNQKLLLTDFARQNGFKNTEIFVDDGISGVTFERPAFKKILELIENDQISTLIVKDMSRLGRNYIEVGNLTEVILPMHNVRLIAVNDGVDSACGEDDFAPFRNIINEWYARDISRKIRSSLKAKDGQSYAIGQPPYGYKRNPENPKLWVIDNESAAVVKKIFNLRLQGQSITKISRLLKREKILIPSQYALKNGTRKPSIKKPRNKFLWDDSIIRKILLNQCYVGDVVNFKTYKKSFKLRKQCPNSPENWKIHKNVHPAIVSRENFNEVQRTFRKTKLRKPKIIEKNMFAGFLKCSDCGANLNYKTTFPNPDNHYFSCRNSRNGSGLCTKTHHIRVDRLIELAKHEIFGIIKFANDFEDEFVKIVMDENYRQVQISQKRNFENLTKLIERDKKIDVIMEQLFEEKVLCNLTEKRFLKLSEKYENEQLELKAQIKNLKKIVIEEEKHELNAEGFLKIAKKYSKIDEITLEVLQAFIDKIVVFHRENRYGSMVQKVDFYFKMIGKVKIPVFNRVEMKRYLKAFGRKKQ